MISVKHLDNELDCGLSEIVSGKIEGWGSLVALKLFQLN